eukprot:gene14-12826_t
MLAKREGYPSARAVICAVEHTKFQLCSRGWDGEVVEKNMERLLLLTYKRPKIMMVDEVAVDQTPRYDSCNNLDPALPMYGKVKYLALLDTTVGPHDVTEKHCGKRLRERIKGPKGVLIGHVLLTGTIHKHFLPLAGCKNMDAFLHPKDSMNAQCAEDLGVALAAAVIKNAFFCAAKAQLHQGDMELFLFQLGNNALEEIFAWLRTLSHQRNMDCLNFQHNVGIAGQMNSVYDRNLGWKLQRSKISVRDDRDRPNAVKGDRFMKSDISLSELWNGGRAFAAMLIQESKLFEDSGANPTETYFVKLAQSGGMVSLLRPEGTPVGAKPYKQTGGIAAEQVEEEEEEEEGFFQRKAERAVVPLSLVEEEEEELNEEDATATAQAVEDMEEATAVDTSCEKDWMHGNAWLNWMEWRVQRCYPLT